MKRKREDLSDDTFSDFIHSRRQISQFFIGLGDTVHLKYLVRFVKKLLAEAQTSQIRRLLTCLRGVQCEPFWVMYGPISISESVKLFHEYIVDDTTYFPLYKSIISRSHFPVDWLFVKDVYLSGASILKRLVKFSEYCPTSAAVIGRHILDNTNFALPMTVKSIGVTYKPNTRCKANVVALLERKNKLAQTLTSDPPLSLSCGISGFLLQHTSIFEEHEMWVINHTMLARYALRSEYCNRCTHRFVCDSHRKSIRLVPLRDMLGWKALRQWLEVCMHLVQFDGMSKIESILFMENVVHLQAHHLSNMSPTHPKNIHRAMVRLIYKQRDLLLALVHGPEYILQEKSKYDSVEKFIQKVDFCHRIIMTCVILELSAASGEEQDPTDPDYQEFMRDDYFPLFQNSAVCVAVSGKLFMLHRIPGKLVH
jgi:hypothetical protein